MPSQFQQARWAAARLAFLGYITFSMVTVVGGFLTAPLMTWYFFGDWRFWRHWSAGKGLMPHGWRLLRLMMKDSRGFMFAVPLTSPPRSVPNPDGVTLHHNWPHGESCGDCSDCCRAGGYACPLLDETTELCRGYDSFYWRHFNCGRFPSVAHEIDYYGCRKWVLASDEMPAAEPLPVPSVSLQSMVESACDMPVMQTQQRGTGLERPERAVFERRPGLSNQPGACAARSASNSAAGTGRLYR